MKRLFFVKFSTLVVLLFVFALAITLPLGVFAQGNRTVDNFEANLSTPYHTVLTHYHFLQSQNYDPNKAATAFLFPGVDTTSASRMAIRLKQAWDGRGHRVDMDALPRDAEYTDTVTQEQRFIPVSQTPDIYVERQPNGQWLYSRDSFEAIEQFYSEVFPYGSDRLMELLPHSSHYRFLGLYLWQHLGILLIITLAFLLHKLLTFIFNRLLYRGAHQLGYDKIVRPYLLPVARPLSMFAVFLMIVILYPLLQLPVQASFYLNYGFRAILPFFGILVFYKLVDVFGLYLESVAGRSETSLDNNVVPLLKKILRVFVVIVGGLFILQNLDVNITALLAGLSIGGLALALAAQDTLKNLFGSLMIFMDKPFSVGHWISSGEIDGTVEEVGFRSTRIRTFRNSLTYVPNGKLADSTIDNHGLRQYRRLSMHIAVTYDTPPDLIEVFVLGLRRIVEDHPQTRKDFYIIEFNEMGDFSLRILFYIFFAVPTWPEELKARHEVLIEIVRLAEKLGVRFAFPTQTLHMENIPGRHSLTPQYDMTMNDFKKVMDDYFEAKKGK
ncbi:MAG: mechanosensitive ion channel family protein [Bacteroidetes bacterium]|nr:MAG: mechanosensitive ion channel family protein [Bacteroidota bacterium]